MSIVKELVENAIDAGGTAITIEIKGGGVESILVRDNGSGILAEDAATAFLRHATSKITATEDLGHIDTLGFRGEALASIASVAQVVMRTRTQGAETGVLLRIEGGELLENAPVACAVGTSVEVKHVFYNVPARLKFLRSARAETTAISDYVSRVIMANPSITFKFINGDKSIYQSTGDGALQHAIYCVYGSDILEYLRPVDYDDGRFRLTGYVGAEQAARPNRLQQSLYVNGRYIRSPKISLAVQRAFDTRLMHGRFPFYVLHIQVDSEQTDVNVHPSKMEIRFRDEEGVQRAATIAVRMALGDPVAPVIRRENIPSFSKGRENPALKPNFGQTAEKPYSASYAPTAPAQSAPNGIRDALFTPVSRPAYLREDEPPRRATPTAEPPPTPTQTEMPVQQQSAMRFGSEPYAVIGQLFECYWAVQQGERVFFIDQHAAHERRLYEKLMAQELAAESQQLLTPAIIKLSPVQFDTLLENLPQFAELGFDISEFGALTVSVRAVPAIIGQSSVATFLQEAIAQLDKRNKLTAVELKRTALIQTACKHAIKAGARLDAAEIRALLAEYEQSGIPMTCPHGRPVMIQMTKLEFEKLFKRVL
jgi:DNA mismatch repair protein MutL